MGIEPIGTCFADKLLAISSPFVKISVVFVGTIHKKARLLRGPGFAQTQRNALRAVGPDPSFSVKTKPLVRTRTHGCLWLKQGLGLNLLVHRVVKWRSVAGCLRFQPEDWKPKTENRKPTSRAQKKPGVACEAGLGISSGRNSGSGPFPDRASPALAPIPAGIQNAKSFGVLVALHRRNGVVSWFFDAAKLEGSIRLCQLFCEKFFGKSSAFPTYTTCKKGDRIPFSFRLFRPAKPPHRSEPPAPPPLAESFSPKTAANYRA